MYMYLDDGYIIAAPFAMERILAHLREVFGNCGVSLNESKLQVWASDPAVVPEALVQFYNPCMTILKRHLETPGDSSHQGLPLTTTRQTCSWSLQE
jgi:hypothetical protein